MRAGRGGFVVALGVILVALAAGAEAGPFDGPGASKALVCSACHGFAGASPSDTMPILAGIDVAYFKKAIGDYATGRRPSPEMEPYAKMVNQFGIDDIAAYFTAQPRSRTPVRVDPAAVARGKSAANQCVVCHGPEGTGDRAKLIPDLTGQPPGYLRNQMLLFKTDQRSPGEPTLRALKALMREIPDNTLADLAAYYSSLRP